MLVARRLVVRGRVQGVGFRHHICQAAQGAGVQGWVRNQPDGSVEAWLEGEAQTVERVDTAVRRGPMGARVESVDVSEEPATGRATGFRIEG
jgi:acylphosphatase